MPLLIMNAADDPIAQYNVKEGVFDAETLAANPNLVVAVTATGGHLGWCDAADPAARRAGRRTWLWIFWRRRARRPVPRVVCRPCAATASASESALARLPGFGVNHRRRAGARPSTRRAIRSVSSTFRLLPVRREDRRA